MEDSSKGTTEEDSGWTAYFDDFLAQQQRNDPKINSCVSDHSFCSPSLVSDAASALPWKKNPDHPTEVDDRLMVMTTQKKLSFKKTRTKEISHHDDSLEDTASSPVNSPKVGSLKLVDISPRKRNDNNEIPKGRDDDAFNISSGIEIDGKNQVNIEGNNDSEYSELKNKGLCLVPLSMLVNYIG